MKWNFVVRLYEGQEVTAITTRLFSCNATVVSEPTVSLPT
jgi:hypothetical protein